MADISQTTLSIAYLEWKFLGADAKFTEISSQAHKSPIDNNPTLVYIIAWRRTGDKIFSEPMMSYLLTYIYVIRPQWVKEWQSPSAVMPQRGPFLVIVIHRIVGNWSHFHITHLGRVTHICVSKLTIIGSDNGLSPERRQAIIWTNAGILLIGPLGTNFSEN